eukprot:6479253-Amphidinium_carterae.1
MISSAQTFHANVFHARRLRQHCSSKAQACLTVQACVEELAVVPQIKPAAYPLENTARNRSITAYDLKMWHLSTSRTTGQYVLQVPAWHLRDCVADVMQ